MVGGGGEIRYKMRDEAVGCKLATRFKTQEWSGRKV